MTELNGRWAQVIGVLASAIIIDINTTGFTAYTSGGTATPFQPMQVAGGAIGIVYDDAVPSGDLVSTLARVKDRLVQLEG
jgi:hypothetical protein